MAIIDSQVHVYEANTPQRPWHSVPNWPDHVTGDEMVAAMDKVGVDGAIFISPFSMYRYDASYAVEVQKAHPDRFAIVKPVDPNDPAVDDVVADWKRTPGAVGIRIMFAPESKREPNDPGLDRILRAASAALVPDGRFVFTIEQLAGEGEFKLLPSGRYAHAPGYVTAAAQRAGFRGVQSESFDIRVEAGRPVSALIYALEKAA